MAPHRKPTAWDVWARSVIGPPPVPFADKGRTRSGFDCWGLLRLAWFEIRGIEIPSYAESYSTTRDPRSIGAAFKQHLQEFVCVQTKEEFLNGGRRERPGDGVLLRGEHSPFHVGLVLPKRLMLHIDDDGLGPRVEPYDMFVWDRRVLGFYRPRSA